MDTLPSSEFRKRFARLTKPTIVTVNGRLLGVWNPSTPMTTSIAKTFDVPEVEALTDDPSYITARATAQMEREKFVRGIETFNTRPFQPVPKPRSK